MRVVCLQHADYETPDAIEAWARDRGHAFAVVRPLFEEYPDTGDFEMLVVMGGPMGAYEDATYPWLAAERSFIREAADAGRLVLGVCLGAQLTAMALGGAAHPHTVRELGWFPVRLTPAGRASRVLAALPDEFVVGLWHGDTYDLPPGVETAATSEACPNQAFEMRDGRVVGMQFHLEWSASSLETLSDRHPDWFTTRGPFVQTREQLTHPGAVRDEGVRLLERILDAMAALS